MKAEMTEEDGYFALVLTPETLEEAGLLVRFGINRTSELQRADTQVWRDLSLSSYITIGKRRNCTSNVPVKK